jgi:lipopolysaccharide export system protein LptA
MTRNNKILQFFLLSLGFILIVSTYFLYPMVKNNTFKEYLADEKKSVLDSEIVETESNDLAKADADNLIETESNDLAKADADNLIETGNNLKKTNTFDSIEYKGIYNLDKEFIIKSKKAYIYETKPEIVHMKNMKATIRMSDGRIVTITSDLGTYNKVTYDSYFEQNVKATDGETVIESNNLDLISTKDFASAYNDVVLTDNESLLLADKVDYDFSTKNYHISMFNNKKIKMKLIK